MIHHPFTLFDRQTLVEHKAIYEEHSALLVAQQKALHEALINIEDAIGQKRAARSASLEALSPYISCFSDVFGATIGDCLSIQSIQQTTRTIDTVTFNLADTVLFKQRAMPALHTPTWLFYGLPLLENYLRCEVQLAYLNSARTLLAHAWEHKALLIHQLTILSIDSTAAKIAGIDEQHAALRARYEHHCEIRRFACSR